jgi:glutathione synthase/RimK-type ligase-like ATP-grasp enzyme
VVTRQIALASCDRLLPDGDPDDQVLVRACARLGIDVSVVAWSDPAVDWAGFDLTVIRSTWDYTDHREQFLSWLDRVPRLHNPAAVVAANSDKLYLADLVSAGIPVVPTYFVAPGQPVLPPDSGEIVLKPSVGAGSRGAGRFVLPDDRDLADQHAAQLHAAGRTVMVQPYQADVDRDGETAMIYLDGQFSHAIRKGPMLAPAVRHRVDGDSLFVAEQISVRTPSAAEREIADLVMAHYAATSDTQPLLYARVDLLPRPSGPVVIEVELSEPSLFLGMSPGAAETLATAIAGRIR